LANHTLDRQARNRKHKKQRSWQANQQGNGKTSISLRAQVHAAATDELRNVATYLSEQENTLQHRQ